MRWRTGIAGIVAGMVLGFLAPAMRADFTLTVQDKTGTSFSVMDNGTTPTFSTAGPNAATAASGQSFGNTSPTSFTGSVTFDGYTMTVTASGTSNQVDLNSFNVTPATGKSTTLNATTFNYSLSTSTITFPAPGPGSLGNTLSVGTDSNKASVNSTAFYATYSAGPQTYAKTGGPTSVYTNVNALSGTLSVGGTFTLPAQAKSSPKQSFGFDAQANLYAGPNGTKGPATGGTLTNTPEPSGVLTAALGLPCMAGVLFLLRRRAVKMAAVV